MNKKINVSFIVMGIASIIVFVLLVRFTYTLRDIRINGEIKQCPIVSIDYATKGGNSANVVIDGKELIAGRISNQQKVGDIITVRYIKGKSWVVQDRVRPFGFYLYFGLESILLIVGVTFIIGGFMGKTFYGSYFSKSSKKHRKK